jgi:hypothetical protein
VEQNWPWPDSLDALVAAPECHRLLFENEEVRVLETVVRSGQTTPVHTHRWPAVLYVLASAHFVRRDPDGTVLLDTRAADALPELNTAAWTAPFPPHTLENVDTSELRVLDIELKRG